MALCVRGAKSVRASPPVRDVEAVVRTQLGVTLASHEEVDEYQQNTLEEEKYHVPCEEKPVKDLHALGPRWKCVGFSCGGWSVQKDAIERSASSLQQIILERTSWGLKIERYTSSLQ